jgi:hypothetical protein
MLSYFRHSTLFCLRNIITALPNRIISSMRGYICWCFQHFLIQKRRLFLFKRSGVKICIMIKVNKTFPPLNNPKYLFSCRILHCKCHILIQLTFKRKQLVKRNIRKKSLRTFGNCNLIRSQCIFRKETGEGKRSQRETISRLFSIRSAML